MRLEWLEDILAIAETGSFSGAAERRRLTQSAFSRRVQHIEEFIGVALFDRSHKPVRLRPTTLAQSGQIEHIAAALRQLIVDLRRGDRIASNRIVIASQHALTTSLTPQIIQNMSKQDGDVHVRLRSANRDECLTLLLSRQADIAILYRLLDEANELSGDFIETIACGSDLLIPVFAEDLTQGFALAPPSELLYIAYPADVFLGEVMARKILPLLAPVTLASAKAETALTLAALEMAAVGVGVAWVPKSLAQDRLQSGRLFDLSKCLPSCALQVRAVRIQGKTSTAEAALWAQLLALGAQQSP